MAGLTVAELEAVVSVDSNPFTSGLDSMLSAIEGWGGKAGKVFAGVGAIGGAGFAAGVASGMALEDARARFEAELGVTADRAAELGDAAGAAYANGYGESLEEVQGATTAVVSSIKGMRKASESEVQGMTEQVLTFADVFEVDVARAAQVAGQMVKSGLADNATEALDLLTTTMQKVPAQVREDVLDASDEYAQFFSSLGIGGEQAFTMLAKSSEKGMFGIDKTGDALKEFTLLSTDLDASGETYKKLGLDGKQMAADILAGGETANGAFGTIVDGLLGMEDPTARARAAISLFGAPLEDLGVKDIPKFLKGLDAGKDGLGDFEGSTKRMSDAMGSTASANLTSFWRTLKTETIGALGGTLIPWVTNAATALNQSLGPALRIAGDVATTAGAGIKNFGQWVGDNQVPIGIVAGVILAVLLPALVSLGITQAATAAMAVTSWALMQAAAIRGAAASVAASWRVIGAWIATGAGAIASAAATAIAVAGVVAGWVLMGIQSMLGAAKVAAAWFIALGPIGWAIAAIAGVVALIVVYWDEIKAATAAVWQWVVGRVKWAADFAVKIFRNFTLPGLIIKHWDKIKSVTSAAVGAVVGFIRSLPGKAVNALKGLGGLISGVMTGAWNAASGAVTNGISKVMGFIRGLPGKIKSIGGLMKGAGSALIGKFLDGLKALGSLGAGVASNLMNGIIGPINSAIRSINNAIPNKLGIGKFSIDLPDNPFPTIPMMATGAHVTGPTYAMIGEGREAESVLPDSVLRGLLERVHASGRETGQQADRGERALMRDAIFEVRDRDEAADLLDKLGHMLRVARYGGVYS